ncbi:MAG: hypothetical protein KTR16_14555 [Acidiferrobacterales bacterium]|nr:hypothetical protein [Acidiferrobacterales bacterium]
MKYSKSVVSMLAMISLSLPTVHAETFTISHFSRATSDSQAILGLRIDETSMLNANDLFNSVNLGLFFYFDHDLTITISGEAPESFKNELMREVDLDRYHFARKKATAAPHGKSESSVLYNIEVFSDLRAELDKAIENSKMISEIRLEAEKHGYKYIDLRHEKFSLELPLSISLKFNSKPNYNQNEIDGSVKPSPK